MKYAVFDTEQEAVDFIGRIDAIYGWPDAHTETYASPEPYLDKYVVKLKSWLTEKDAPPKYSNASAVAEYEKLPPESIMELSPEEIISGG